MHEEKSQNVYRYSSKKNRAGETERKEFVHRLFNRENYELKQKFVQGIILKYIFHYNSLNTGRQHKSHHYNNILNK